MVTSHIQMLDLPNFDYITTSTILFEPGDKILLVTSWLKIMMAWIFFKNTFILRSPSVVYFADIKTAIMFIKVTFKDSKRFKEL